MKISAVSLARSIALFDTLDLNPRGRVNVFNLVSLLNQRFSFQTSPTKTEDFDFGKGISFKVGYFEGNTIDELTFYNDGIKIDLTSSTEEAKTLLSNTLKWLSNETGIAYSADMVKRWAYLSQLTFFSDIDLPAVHPAFGNLGKKISARVNERTGLESNYQLNGISLNFERLNGSINVSQFLIERRGQTPYSENKYYSAAPLETEDHIQLLTEFESDLKRENNEGR